MSVFLSRCSAKGRSALSISPKGDVRNRRSDAFEIVDVQSSGPMSCVLRRFDGMFHKTEKRQIFGSHRLWFEGIQPILLYAVARRERPAEMVPV